MNGISPPRPSTVATGEPAETPRAVGSRHEQIARLTRVIDDLWRAEPDIAPSGRSRLFERLSMLEHDVMRLSLQGQADGTVDDDLLNACLAEADELRWWWRPTGRDGGNRAA